MRLARSNLDRAVLASLLEHDLGSRRTAERLGLWWVWRGPDARNPDPDAVRLVFLDRDPTPEVMAAIEGRTGRGASAASR